jgi:hypothetical protein
MYDFYKSEQLQIINGIANADDRLKYLYKEKERFGLSNENKEAEKIVLWFDNRIDQTKFEIMRDISLQAAKIGQVDANSNKRNKKSIPDENITLVEFFEYVSKYKAIMEILVEKGFCQPITYIRKDEAKGFKSLIIAIIKHIHSQGYLKRKPTTDEIVLISNSTFRVKISKDTIKRINADSFFIDYIPPATSV